MSTSQQGTGLCSDPAIDVQGSARARKTLSSRPHCTRHAGCGHAPTSVREAAGGAAQEHSHAGARAKAPAASLPALPPSAAVLGAGAAAAAAQHQACKPVVCSRAAPTVLCCWEEGIRRAHRDMAAAATQAHPHCESLRAR